MLPKRKDIVGLLWNFLQERAPRQLSLTREETTYLECMVQKILQSEVLIGKLLDKILPNIGPQAMNNNIMVQTFEHTLGQLRLQRSQPTVAGDPAAIPATPHPSGEEADGD